jgi:hypothetical protein
MSVTSLPMQVPIYLAHLSQDDLELQSSNSVSYHGRRAFSKRSDESTPADDLRADQRGIKEKISPATFDTISLVEPALGAREHVEEAKHIV